MAVDVAGAASLAGLLSWLSAVGPANVSLGPSGPTLGNLDL